MSMSEIGDGRVIVRTRSAGVFFGHLDRDESGSNGRIKGARRLWYWAGAATLSELATEGTSKPASCKFPTPVAWIDVADIIEVLPVTEKAAAAIDGVAVWSA